MAAIPSSPPPDYDWLPNNFAQPFVPAQGTPLTVPYTGAEDSDADEEGGTKEQELSPSESADSFTPNCTNLPTLPPELIDRIVQFASYSQPFDRDRLTILKRCSLVSTVWRDLSQSLLFGELEIFSFEECQSLLDVIGGADRRERKVEGVRGRSSVRRELGLRARCLKVNFLGWRRRERRDEQDHRPLLENPWEDRPSDEQKTATLAFTQLLLACPNIKQLWIWNDLGVAFNLQDLDGMSSLERLYLTEVRFLARNIKPSWNNSLIHLSIRAASGPAISWNGLLQRPSLHTIDFFGSAEFVRDGINAYGRFSFEHLLDIAFVRLFAPLDGTFFPITLCALSLGTSPNSPAISTLSALTGLRLLDVTVQQLKPDDYLSLPPNLRVLRFHGAFPIYPPNVNPKSFLHSVTHIIKGRSSATKLRLLVIPTAYFPGGGSTYQREAQSLLKEYQLVWEESRPGLRGLLLRYSSDYPDCDNEVYGDVRMDTERFRVAARVFSDQEAYPLIEMSDTN